MKRISEKLFPSKKFRIAAQIQAENDEFLFACFHDNGVIEDLIDNRYELIAGRKGTGKTAVARYLQKEYGAYGLDFASRLTLSELQVEPLGTDALSSEKLLKFLAIRTAQKFLGVDLLNEEGEKFWQNYLTVHGLQNVKSYKDWIIKSKSVTETKEAGVKLPLIAAADLKHDDHLEYERQSISDSVSTLMGHLADSFKKEKRAIIIIDDITDQLDQSSPMGVNEVLNQIKYTLHQLNAFNTKFRDDDVGLTFVCTIRDDLWEFIVGSNENKLVNNCLWLKWDERDFCELLIKRLPHFSDSLDEALKDPFGSIKKVFPDEVFDHVMAEKNVNPDEVKQHKTKFYSYMQLISFNRPRDFLRLCRAMKPRLSEVKPVEAKHIKASELEYEVYFYDELRDELNIFALILNLDSRALMSTMSKLSEKSKMSYSELRAVLGQYIKGSHTKTLRFIEMLWNYSLLGVIKGHDYARFKHNQGTNYEFEFPDERKLKEYYFLLHRGLYWKYLRD